MKLWIEAEVLRLTNIRASQNRKVGVPGPEGSTGKLAFAELNKAIYELASTCWAPTGMLYGTLRDDPARDGDGFRHGRRRRSCAAGPTPSRAAPPRSCATSWASGCSACRATCASTMRCPGARCPATEVASRRWRPSGAQRRQHVAGRRAAGRPCPGRSARRPPSITVAATSTARLQLAQVARRREVLVLVGDVHHLDAVGGCEAGDHGVARAPRAPTRRR